MKYFIGFLLLGMLLMACNAQKSSASFQNFNGKEAQNEYYRNKVLPGRPEAEPYEQYVLRLYPAIQGSIQILDSQGNVYHSFEDQYKPVTEIIFNSQSRPIPEEGLRLVIENQGKKQVIILPKPIDKGVLALP